VNHRICQFNNIILFTLALTRLVSFSLTHCLQNWLYRLNHCFVARLRSISQTHATVRIAVVSTKYVFPFHIENTMQDRNDLMTIWAQGSR